MKKVKSYALSTLFSAVLVLGFAAVAGAQGAIPITGVSSAAGDFQSFVIKAINFAIGLTAVVATGVLVYSGFQYITAAGDDGKVEKATSGITYAVIGLVIAFVASILVQFVINSLIQPTI